MERLPLSLSNLWNTYTNWRLKWKDTSCIHEHIRTILLKCLKNKLMFKYPMWFTTCLRLPPNFCKGSNYSLNFHSITKFAPCHEFSTKKIVIWVDVTEEYLHTSGKKWSEIGIQCGYWWDLWESMSYWTRVSKISNSEGDEIE